jgi:radical SAM superfamily enzyme YgiQ (UPF0313 family)
MVRPQKRIALISFDVEVAGSLSTFSYSVHKLKASLLTCPGLEDAEIRVINQETSDPEALLAPLLAFQPTMIGASLYVWSLRPFRELAETYARMHPEVPIVAGGPSARKNVFDLPPYHSFRETVDALVVGEGESVIRELALHHQEPDWKETVRGLHLWNGSEWVLNGETERPVVDDYPSPYHLDTAPPGSGFIETFRGCPVTCSFCQWGGAPLGGVHSVEYLVGQLQGLQRAQVENVLFLDAAFNLSPRAFRNLAAADAEVEVLKDFTVFGHLYPTHVQDMHLELFAKMGRVHPAIGIQSFVPEVLERIGRTVDLQRFERVVAAIRADYGVDLELIMGLPGDRPASFKETVEKAIEISDSVRIAFCMILPDALLDRARPHDGIEFDHETFFMRSCAGWSEAELAETWAWVNDVASQFHSQENYGSWVGFRTEGEPARAETRIPEVGASGAVPAPTVERLREVVTAASADFHLRGMTLKGGKVRAALGGPIGDIVLEACPSDPKGRFFLRLEGVDYSHSGDVGREGAEGLKRVIDSLHRDVRQLLTDGAPDAGLVQLGGRAG